MFACADIGAGLDWQGVPILPEPNLTLSIDHQHMTRGNFVNALEKSLRRRRGYKGEVVIESFFIDFRRYFRVSQQSLDLRRKHEAAIVLIVVERFHARAIARQHEALAIGVPQRNREITFNLINKVEAALFIKMQDSL